MSTEKSSRNTSSDALKLSEQRFRTLFTHCPIGLEELDLSQVKRRLDALGNKGVEDFRAYFKTHPAELRKCASLIRIISVNEAAMASLGANTPEEYSAYYFNVLGELSLSQFGEELAQFIDGQTSVKIDTYRKTPEGDTVDVELRASVAPGSEATFNRVYTSIIDVCALKNTVRRQERITDEMLETASRITEIHDPCTIGHQHRVAALAEAIGNELGLNENRVRALKVSGTIHDLGKLYIPMEILSKPCELTDIEAKIVQLHPEAGRNILEDIEFQWPITDIVYQHHERLDGSGYPEGIRANDICLEAMIIAVADVVEAMSQHRVYRAEHGFKMAFDELKKNKGILYDPKAVDACQKLFSESRFRFN